MAQMKIMNSDSMEYICDTFEKQPYIILKNDMQDNTEPWQLKLIDPFGREIQTNFSFIELKKNR